MTTDTKGHGKYAKVNRHHLSTRRMGRRPLTSAGDSCRARRSGPCCPSLERHRSSPPDCKDTAVLPTSITNRRSAHGGRHRRPDRPPPSWTSRLVGYSSAVAWRCTRRRSTRPSRRLVALLGEHPPDAIFPEIACSRAR